MDLADFDGSFPAAAAKMLGDPELDGTYVVLGATKTDLLPKTASPIRLEQWVRKRAKAGGLENIDKVKFLVRGAGGRGGPGGEGARAHPLIFSIAYLSRSFRALWRSRARACGPRHAAASEPNLFSPPQPLPSRFPHHISCPLFSPDRPQGSPNGFGVSILAQTLEELSRQRSGAEIWVIGSQNAGKSSLINALSDFYYGADPPVRGLFLISTVTPLTPPAALHRHHLTVASAAVASALTHTTCACLSYPSRMFLSLPFLSFLLFPSPRQE